MRLTAALCLTLFGTITASAATITSASAQPSVPTIFTETIGSSFSASTFSITQSTVQCNVTGGCPLGNVADFTATVTGLTSLTPFTIAIDGSVNGTAQVNGKIISPLLPLGLSFSVLPGPIGFNKTLLSSALPAAPGGALTITGTLQLALAAGQTLTLPSSLSFTVGAVAAAVPEPGTSMLLGAALLGIAALRRRRES